MNKCIVHLKGDVSASEQIAALTCMQNNFWKKKNKNHKTKLVALLVILSLH